MQEILRQLGIQLAGEYSTTGSYIIDLDNDTEWGKVYTLLDNAEVLEQDEASVLLNVHDACLIYNYDDTYRFVLKADFDYELYSLPSRAGHDSLLNSSPLALVITGLQKVRISPLKLIQRIRLLTPI